MGLLDIPARLLEGVWTASEGPNLDTVDPTYSEQHCRISLYMRISKDANLTLGKNMEHWLNEEMELHD